MVKTIISATFDMVGFKKKPFPALESCKMSVRRQSVRSLIIIALFATQFSPLHKWIYVSDTELFAFSVMLEPKAKGNKYEFPEEPSVLYAS